MMTASRNRSRGVAWYLCAAILAAGVFTGCNRRIKQEAVLAIDAAKLSLADAKNLRPSSAAGALIRAAEASLKRAEKSFANKNYREAQAHANSALLNGKKALEEAKKKPAKKSNSKRRT